MGRMPLVTDFYKLLDVSCTASITEITHSFLTLCNQQQLDLTDKIQLYQAYQTLAEPAKRAEYDNALMMSKFNDNKQPSTLQQTPNVQSDQPIQQLKAISNQDNRLETLLLNSDLEAPPPLCPQTLDEVNQREFTRAELNGIVTINAHSQASIIDISPKGLQASCNDEFDEDEVVQISSNIVNGIAQICFVGVNEGHGFVLGMKFLKANFSPQLFVNVHVF